MGMFRVVNIVKLGGGGILGSSTDVGSSPFKSRTRPMPRPFNRTNSLSVLEPFIASVTGRITSGDQSKCILALFFMHSYVLWQ